MHRWSLAVCGGALGASLVVFAGTPAPAEDVEDPTTDEEVESFEEANGPFASADAAELSLRSDEIRKSVEVRAGEATGLHWLAVDSTDRPVLVVGVVGKTWAERAELESAVAAGTSSDVTIVDSKYTMRDLERYRDEARTIAGDASDASGVSVGIGITGSNTESKPLIVVQAKSLSDETVEHFRRAIPEDILRLEIGGTNTGIEPGEVRPL